MNRSIREKIENYLLNRMPAEEKKAFEEQIRQDEALAKQVQQQKWIQEAILEKDVLAFREKIEGIKTKISGKKKVIPLRRILGLAAGVLILILAGFWLLKPTYTSEELFASYYTAPEPSAVLPASYYASRQGGSEDDSTVVTVWREARQLLEQQQWTGALNKMETVPLDEVAFLSEYHYELGILYLENGLYEEAINALQKVENGQAYSKAWYLALSYMAIDDAENARTQLLQLVGQPNAWREEARGLLRKLPS